ncbi:MAG: pilus assembly protein [Chloroflexi bacterium]|nr:pilus assembly protein [Chloroflexota bacterium]
MKQLRILDCRFSILNSELGQWRAQSEIQIQKPKIDLRSRRGLAELLSTLVALPLLLLVIAFILYFGRALYAKAAIEDAAAVGARWAGTSLGGQQGCRQARESMAKVFQGYYIDPAGATVSVRPVTLWGRGTRALVDVRYNVSQRRVPILGPLLGDVTVKTQYSVPIDTFNNRYDYGWLPCN